MISDFRDYYALLFLSFHFGIQLQTTDQVKNACADEMTETLGESVMFSLIMLSAEEQRL